MQSLAVVDNGVANPCLPNIINYIIQNSVLEGVAQETSAPVGVKIMDATDLVFTEEEVAHMLVSQPNNQFIQKDVTEREHRPSSAAIEVKTEV